MAYDRYDTRGSNNDRGQRRQGDDDRGFFQRAGDEISGWFEGDTSRGDHDRRSGRDYPMHRNDRDQRPADAMGSDRAYDRGFGRSYTPDHDQQRNPSNQGAGYHPMTGDYSREGSQRGEGTPYDRDPTRDTSYAGSSAPNDPHYHSWRRQQMEQLDRDYDDYRREHQSRFEEEFGGWRAKRDEKKSMLGQVRDQMDVVGNDGEHVGTVDCVKGDRIVLAKSDPDSGGMHHSLNCSAIDCIRDDKLVLDMSADKARDRWRDEGRERALFERRDQGEDGPHILDRSFSGTYRS